jgi:hypothetical protein
MYAVIAVAAIGAVIIAGMVATHHGTNPTAGQPQQTTLGAPATPPAYNLAIGQSATIITQIGYDSWDVTVISVAPYTQSQSDAAPPAGSHWVAVNVTYTASKGRASVDPMDWKLKLHNGQTIDPTIMKDSNTALQATTIPPPNKKTGDLYLAVPDGATAVTVVYSAGPSPAASWDISSPYQRS